MKVFTEMADQGLNEMLGHPVSKTFLEMKWDCVKWNFFPVLALYMALGFFLTVFSYCVTDMKEHTWKYDIQNNSNLTIDPIEIFSVGPEKQERK